MKKIKDMESILGREMPENKDIWWVILYMKRDLHYEESEINKKIISSCWDQDLKKFGLCFVKKIRT